MASRPLLIVWWVAATPLRERPRDAHCRPVAGVCVGPARAGQATSAGSTVTVAGWSSGYRAGRYPTLERTRRLPPRRTARPPPRSSRPPRGTSSTSGSRRVRRISPPLLDKIGKSMAYDFDYAEEVRGLQAPTLIVAADADMAPPSHYAEVFNLLDGGLRYRGWTGEGRPRRGHRPRQPAEPHPRQPVQLAAARRGHRGIPRRVAKLNPPRGSAVGRERRPDSGANRASTLALRC